MSAISFILCRHLGVESNDGVVHDMIGDNNTIDPPLHLLKTTHYGLVHTAINDVCQI